MNDINKWFYNNYPDTKTIIDWKLKNACIEHACSLESLHASCLKIKETYGIKMATFKETIEILSNLADEGIDSVNGFNIIANMLWFGKKELPKYK